jgi:hypothetical protein
MAAGPVGDEPGQAEIVVRQLDDPGPVAMGWHFTGAARHRRPCHQRPAFGVSPSHDGNRSKPASVVA